MQGLVGLRITKAQYAAVVFGIIIGCRYKGIVTATHHLIIDNQFAIEVEGGLTWHRHAAPVTATEEGTDIGRIILVVRRVTIGQVVEHYSRLERHGSSLHVSLHLVSVRQVHLAEVVIIDTAGVHVQDFLRHVLGFRLCGWIITCHHLLTVVAQEHVVSDDVGTHLQLDQRIIRKLCMRWL